ncbi:MAG: VCBS repeat-containing protein [Planctomycetes bacterium]|nr:VCBS repeat-containing protein [Planctomycetota bacterium]
MALLIGGCALAPLCAQPVVSSVSPSPNANGAALGANVSADFSTNMAQPGAGEFRLFSKSRGWVGGGIQASGNTITLDPTVDLFPSEELQAILTGDVQDAQANPMGTPYSWQFRAAAVNRAASFGSINNQYNGLAGNGEGVIVTADFNGDGFTDIFDGQYGAQDKVFLGNGQGGFTAVNVGGSSNNCYAAAAGDFDEDGDMDLVVSGYGQQDRVFFNNGSGSFTTSINIGTGSEETMSMNVADIDGDGHLDIVAVTGGISASADAIYLGDGQGGFTSTVIEIYPGTNVATTSNAWDVALGDMDGDGDIDIVTAEFSLTFADSSRIFWNDGHGGFDLQNMTAYAVPMQAICLDVGDIDNDGDTDIVLGTNDNSNVQAGYTYFYFNDGTGNFNATSTTAIELTWTVKLADFDGDGDLDLLFGEPGSGSRVGFNNGAGQFAQAQSLGSAASNYFYGVGDVDNDGDLDVVNHQWLFLNGGSPASIEVTFGGNTLTDGDTVPVAYNTTLSSLAPAVSVTDLDQDTVDINLSVTGNPNIDPGQWQLAGGQTPFNLTPTTGVFDQGGVTHDFTLSASDGINTTTFTFHVVVSGGAQPSMSVSENGNAIADGSAATAGRDFGSRDITAGAGTALSIELANSGAANLDITSVTLAGGAAGEFILDTSSMAGSVTPGNATAFTIAFDPSTVGVKTAQVEIQHNDPGLANPFSFEIKGEGTVAPAIVVKVSGATTVSGGAISFSSFTVGSTAPAPQVVTIENHGSGDLQVGTPVLSGAGFTLDTSGFNGVVSPGGSTSFQVLFSATSTGNYNAAIEFTHDDSAATNPFVLNVTGQVVDPVADSGGSGSGSGGCVGVAGGSDWHSILLLMLVMAALAVCKGARRKRA